MRFFILLVAFFSMLSTTQAQSYYSCEFTHNSCQSYGGTYRRALPYYVNNLRDALRECKRMEMREGREFCRVVEGYGYPQPNRSYICQLAREACHVNGGLYSVRVPQARDQYDAQQLCRQIAYQRRDVLCRIVID
jgi:hypothetical protein